MQHAASARADLFRVLGDEDRMRMLALCDAEELTVGELATVLRESQPQITKKSQPLRDAGLLLARRDGARTLLKAADIVDDDAIVRVALDEGRALCAREGSLLRAAAVVAEREEQSRRFFSAAAPPASTPAALAAEDEVSAALPLLSMFSPLLPGRALAVDVGTGVGALLPLLSPLYERVIAVDRSASRLAICATRIHARGLSNVRLREADVDDPALAQEIREKGGADLVLLARVLHFNARPQDAVAAAASLLKSGGHLIVIDDLPHDDESLREQGHVWLGFDTNKLKNFLTGAHLEVRALHPLSSREQLAVARKTNT